MNHSFSSLPSQKRSSNNRAASPISKKYKLGDELTIQTTALLELDSLVHPFGFLNPSELLQVALVSKTWREQANEIATHHLVETQTNHSVSDCWRQRLAQYGRPEHLAHDEKTTSTTPARCLWKAAHVLHLNQFALPFEDTAFFYPHVVGLPITNKTAGAIAMVRPDGFLRILDTRLGQWTQISVVTGEAIPNYDIMANDGMGEEQEGGLGRCHCGSLFCVRDYLVYWNSISDHFVSVWRLIPDQEPQFLHHTRLNVRRDLDLPDYAQQYHVDAAVRDGVLIVHYVCDVWEGDLDEEPTPEQIHVQDECQFSESFMARFGLAKEDEEYEFHRMLAFDLFDLETGHPLLEEQCNIHVTRKPFREKVCYRYEDVHGVIQCQSNDRKHWLEASNQGGDADQIHEVDKTEPGQPLVRTLRTGKFLSAICPSKAELVAYLDPYVDGDRHLQTFLLY